MFCCETQGENHALLNPFSRNYGTVQSGYTGPYEGWQARLDSFFKVTERQSTLKTEFIAGFANFVASSYMLVLVPAMVSKGGVDSGVSMVGFVAGTFFCSVVLGILSNLPIPSGPGLGSATYFAYSLSQMHPQGDLSSDPNPRYILSVCFASGLVMTAIALMGLPMRIFDLLPASVKEAMPAGLGMLLALCGLQQIGLVVASEETGTGLGDLSSTRTMLGLATLFLMAFLDIKKFRAAYLIPMVFTTVVAWTLGYHPWPQGFAAVPPLGPWYIDLSLLDMRMISPIISIYLICLLDIAGISYGAVRVAGLLNRDGSIPNAYWIFVINGVSTMLTAVMGTTPCIVFGEAFAGVFVGGKTGLTAVFMGFIYLATMPFIPVLCAVPMFASAPVLIIVGGTLLGLLKHLDWEDQSTILPSFFTVALMPFLHAIDQGIIGGLAAHFVLVFLDFLSSPFTAMAKFRAWTEESPRRRSSAMGSLFEHKLAAFRVSLKQRVKTEDDLHNLFNSYDQQNTGSLTRSDLSRLALALGAGLSPEDIERAVISLDPTSQDGMVRLGELKNWLKSPGPPRATHLNTQ